jgi:hypothetical protein
MDISLTNEIIIEQRKRKETKIHKTQIWERVGERAQMYICACACTRMNVNIHVNVCVSGWTYVHGQIKRPR